MREKSPAEIFEPGDWVAVVMRKNGLAHDPIEDTPEFMGKGEVVSADFSRNTITIQLGD